jgi:hypothetical protein
MKISNKLIVYLLLHIKNQQSKINNPKSGEGDHLVRRRAASPDKLRSFKKSCVILLLSLTKTIERKISHLYVSFVEITLMAQGSIKVIIKELKTPRYG